MSTAIFRSMWPSVTPATKDRIKLSLLYLMSAICGMLLFVQGPDYYAPRSYQAAWNLGHDLTFFLWMLLLIHRSPAFAKKSIAVQLLVGIVITVPLGLFIEWIQGFVGRTFSVGDVARDINGTMLAIAFLSPAGMALRMITRGTLRAAALALLLAQLYPVLTAVTDEVIATKQFPILSSLETPRELSRWSSSSPIAVDHQIARQGQASLRVDLKPSKYSGVALRYFPADWHKYKLLHLSILNPSQEPLRVTCRINDKAHIANGQSYHDRFNRDFILAHGWNDIDIPMVDIKQAPKNRLIDLRQIQNIMIFASGLQVSRTIYIDDVRLQ